MGYHMKSCYKCKKELHIDKIVGRKDACPFCGSDLRCCRNCRHFDQRLYNQCRESQADRVLDKERSNFCDYFSFIKSRSDMKKKEGEETTRDKLEALFKK
jgi:hypothetical protein